jgi:hypothetical protein
MGEGKTETIILNHNVSLRLALFIARRYGGLSLLNSLALSSIRLGDIRIRLKDMNGSHSLLTPWHHRHHIIR